MSDRNELTQVTTRSTLVKFYNSEINTVQDITLVGDLNITECKQYIADNKEGCIFISKELIKETFNVNTIALIQLREE